jgi:hypothetical protein
METGRDPWSAGSGGLGCPAAGDESLVPAQDRGGRDKETESPASGEQPNQGGNQGSVGPADPRPRTAPLQHSKLVAQDEDLDLLGGVSDRVRSTIQLSSLENTR